MKVIVNHLRYRFLHVILPLIVITCFYWATSIIRIPEMMVKNMKEPFTTYLSTTGRIISLFIVMGIIIIVALYMMYRDTHNSKARYMLLPQSRHNIWIIDALIIVFFLLCVILIQYFTYRNGFYEYIELVHEYHEFPYWQTGSALDALYTVSISKWLYPTEPVMMLYGFLSLCAISLCVPYVYTMLTTPKVKKSKITIMICFWAVCAYGNAMMLHEFIQLILMCLLIFWITYNIWYYWNTNRIGG